ncbi:uncharacterized protein LOC141852212 isoform X2 [Brevipalpus obovatus]
MMNGVRSKATGHRKMQRSIRSPIKPSAQNQSGGVLGFFMPFYSIAIVLFFVYTLMKYLSRNKVSENVDENFMTNLEKHRETLANLTERLKNIRTKSGPIRNGEKAPDRSKINGDSDYDKRQVPIRGSGGDNHTDSRKEISQAIKILLADLMELREFAYAIEEHAVHEQAEWQRQLKRCQFRCQDANHNANLNFCGIRGKHPAEAKNEEKKILRTDGTQDEDGVKAEAEDQEYESDMENDGPEEAETSNLEEIFEDKNEEYSVSESYSRDDNNEIDYTDEESYNDEESVEEEEYEDEAEYEYEDEYEEDYEEEYEEERLSGNLSDNCDPSDGLHEPLNIFRRKSIDDIDPSEQNDNTKTSSF